MRKARFFQRLKKGAKNFIANDLPGFYPLILLFIIGVGIFFAFIIHRTDYAIRGIIIAVPGVLAAGFLLRLFRKDHPDKEIGKLGYIPFTPFGMKKCNTMLLFIVLYLFSVISLLLVDYRPWYYFVFIAALFSLIFFQILQNHPSFLILIEILGTSLNLIYGVTLKYPLFFGATDTIPHLYLSKITLLSGHSITPDISFTYANYPLYHIFVAISQIFTGLPLNVSYFLIIAIPFVFVLFFLYKLFFILSENTRIALTGCLIYATSAVVVEYSQYVITRVFAYVGFIILIYALYKIVNSPPHIRTSLFCVILMDSFYLVLVHQVSLYQILFLLLLIFVIEQVIGDKKIINLKYIIFLIIIFIGYQLFSEGGFFSTIIKTRFNILMNENLATVRSSIQNINEYDFLTHHLGLAIFAFFIFVGIGYILWTYRSKQLSIIGLFTLLVLVFFLPNPLVMSTIITVHFRADRVTLLIAPFMAFVAAIGLMAVEKYSQENHIPRNFLSPLFLTIIFIFSFASIALPIASDSRDFGWYHERDDYFNNEELTSFDYVQQYVPSGSVVSGDNAVSILFTTKKIQQAEGVNLPYFRSEILKREDFNAGKHGYTILRDDEFQKNGLELDSGLTGEWDKFVPKGENVRNFTYFSSSGNVIFDSTGMKIVYL